MIVCFGEDMSNEYDKKCYIEKISEVVIIFANTYLLKLSASLLAWIEIGFSIFHMLLQYSKWPFHILKPDFKKWRGKDLTILSLMRYQRSISTFPTVVAWRRLLHPLISKGSDIRCADLALNGRQGKQSVTFNNAI